MSLIPLPSESPRRASANLAPAGIRSGKLGFGIVSVAFPIAVFILHRAFGPVGASYALFGLLWLRALTPGNLKIRLFAAVAAAGILLGLQVFPQFLAELPLLYPLLVNLFLLGMFGTSLVVRPSLIFRFARAAEPQLPAQAEHYCDRVTLVWCLFFLFNGLASLYTAFWCDLTTWTVYNGAVSYVLIALLFGLELIARSRFRRRYAA